MTMVRRLTQMGEVGAPKRDIADFKGACALLPRGQITTVGFFSITASTRAKSGPRFRISPVCATTE